MGEGPPFMRERKNATVISVLRSHFEEVGESHRECARAVFVNDGIRGNRNLMIPDVESSMLSVSNNVCLWIELEVRRLDKGQEMEVQGETSSNMTSTLSTRASAFEHKEIKDKSHLPVKGPKRNQGKGQ